MLDLRYASTHSLWYTELLSSESWLGQPRNEHVRTFRSLASRSHTSWHQSQTRPDAHSDSVCAMAALAAAAGLPSLRARDSRRSSDRRATEDRVVRGACANNKGREGGVRVSIREA